MWLGILSFLPFCGIDPLCFFLVWGRWGPSANKSSLNKVGDTHKQENGLSSQFVLTIVALLKIKKLSLYMIVCD